MKADKDFDHFFFVYYMAYAYWVSAEVAQTVKALAKSNQR